MRSIRLVLSLALAGAAMSAVPALQSSAAGQPASASNITATANDVVDRMRSEASGLVRISTQRATGRVGMVRSTDDLMPGREADSKASAGTKAASYVRSYAAAFGARYDELRRAGIRADRYGWTVSFTQHYRGVPVFGAKLLANVDRAGRLTSVNGFVAPDLRLSTSPAIGKQEAALHALALVRSQPPMSDSGKAGSVRGIRAATTLVVYRIGAVKGSRARTSWPRGWRSPTAATSATSCSSTRTRASSSTATRWSTTRRAAHLRGRRHQRPLHANEVWQEGDPFPGTLNAGPAELRSGTGEAYWFFNNTFDRDSYDGAGHRCARSTTTRASTARTPTGTASPRTTATASRPTTSSPTSGATPTPSTPTA